MEFVKPEIQDEQEWALADEELDRSQGDTRGSFVCAAGPCATRPTRG